MAAFMVERRLNGIAMSDLAAAQRRAIDAAEAMSKAGVPIRYVRSTFAPETGRCMCMFEAANATEVRTLNERAGIPFDTVSEVLELTP